MSLLKEISVLKEPVVTYRSKRLLFWLSFGNSTRPVGVRPMWRLFLGGGTSLFLPPGADNHSYARAAYKHLYIKYVCPRTEMYAGRVAYCSLLSHVEYAALRALLRFSKRWTDVKFFDRLLASVQSTLAKGRIAVLSPRGGEYIHLPLR